MLLDLRQYYEKSNLAVFLSFVYLSSTLWGLPTAKVHDPVPWGDSLRPYANPALYKIDVPALSYIYAAYGKSSLYVKWKRIIKK